MQLKYTRPDGTTMEFEVTDKPITIGRSPEADLVLMDDRCSRLHCGIRFWDGDFYIKDLKSKNGTFLNGSPIESAKVKPGDRVRIGSITLRFEDENAPGTATILHEVEAEMEHGKGYSTILREIVTGQPKAPAADDDDDEPPPVRIQADAPDPRPSTGKIKTDRLTQAGRPVIGKAPLKIRFPKS
ncbi:MAG: FHA domain-containing protein [Candidatus Marinimicrobia bacterium]|nr:FHA domain-containing protein [Candidatus Neomarinimicrobiota bacterium]